MRPLLGVLVLALVAAACDGGDDAVLPEEEGSGASCGGGGSVSCGPDEYCEMKGNTCGIADEGGRCRTRPATCPHDFWDPLPSPACTCGGGFPSACEGRLAGFDLMDSGGCDEPADHFSCGPLFCRLADQYCERRLPHVGLDGYACRSRPRCEAANPCACLTDEPCGNRCTAVADTAGVMLTCPAVAGG